MCCPRCLSDNRDVRRTVLFGSAPIVSLFPLSFLLSFVPRMGWLPAGLFCLLSFFFCLSSPGGLIGHCSVLSCSVPVVPSLFFVCFPSVFLPPGMVGSVRFCARLSSFSSFLFHTRALVVVGCIPLCSKLCVRWGHAPLCFHLLSIVFLGVSIYL